MSPPPVIAQAGHFTIVRFHSGEVHIEVSPEGRKDFDELLQRAMNCWPDASPHLKELSDVVRYGKVLQNYHTQVR